MRIDLIDIGPTLHKAQTYRSYRDFTSYLKIAADRLHKYLTSATYKYDRAKLIKLQEEVNKEKA